MARKRKPKPQGSRDNPITAIRGEPLFRQRIIPNKAGKARRDTKEPPPDLGDD